ncbi:MAG: LacI family DNA-binding transcriptional regulator [Chloroflexi bacterium]|nr:LacI family DNA-binding transcriptional regulator [Chloroflexota bacterium]
MNTPRLNLDDIAHKAGVSRATVSRVINNKGYVSDDKRARVLQVIEQEGFAPNQAARTLVTKRTQNIGIVIPEQIDIIMDDGRYFSSLLQGITEVTYEHDYGVVLWLSHQSESDEQFYKRITRNRLTDGLLLMSATGADGLLEYLAQDAATPLVTLFEHGRFGGQTHFVTIDNVEAARNAVDHLLRLGRRRIAVITGRITHPDAQGRLQGYKLALAAAGIGFDPQLVVEGLYTYDSGYEGAQKLIGRGFDALFAGNDTSAVGAIRALNEHGLRVPEDVAVIGFDDIAGATSIRPQLTTVHQPVRQIGAQAARLLLEVIAERPTQPRHILLPTHLVVRQSCGAELASVLTPR